MLPQLPADMMILKFKMLYYFFKLFGNHHEKGILSIN